MLCLVTSFIIPNYKTQHVNFVGYDSEGHHFLIVCVTTKKGHVSQFPNSVRQVEFLQRLNQLKEYL